MARLRVPVHLRWSDVDGYQHVNNAKIFTLLEETRIAAFWAGTAVPTGGEALPGGPGAGDPGRAGGSAGTAPAPTAPPSLGPGSGTGTFIAHQEIEYLAPIGYTLQPLTVQLWVSHLGGASIDVCYEIDGPDGPAARAMTTVVLIDEGTGRPRRLTEVERDRWTPFLEEPVRFRRRRERD